MKIEELMIGDLVLINGTPMQIQAIDNTDGEIVAGEDLYCFVEDRGHSEDRITPIPLTPEILEKSGVQKSDSDEDGALLYEFGDEILGLGVWVNITPCLVSAWNTHSDETLQYSMIQELPIKYVHELQHALRLCGIEKDITV